MYCRYCGKEIPENEVCFCEGAVKQRLATQTAVEEVSNAGVSAVKGNFDIMAILHGALEAIIALPKNVVRLFREPQTLLSTPSSIVFAVCCLLLQLLAGMCIAGGLQSTFGQLINSVSDGYISSDMVKIKGIVGIGALCGSLTYIITSVYMWLVNLCCRWKSGKKGALLASFQSAVSTGVFPSMAALIAGLCFLINAVFGLMVLAVAVFLGVAYFSNMLWFLQKRITRTYMLIITALLIAVVVVVVNIIDISILVKFIQGYIEQQANSIYGSMFG